MAIDKEIKKKVTLDWEAAFPQLTLYSQNTLYKIVGCVVIGIELTKLPRSEEYRPHFVMYPLWRKDVKECFDTPILLREFYNKKRLQFSIPYEKHDAYFKETLESIRAQAPILFDGEVPLKSVLILLDEYSKTPPLSTAPNSYLQGKLQESKLQISLYKDMSESEKTVAQINRVNWNADNFKYFGVDVGNWLRSLHEMIINRDEFLKQIKVNKQDKKLSKLQRSELKA